MCLLITSAVSRDGGGLSSPEAVKKGARAAKPPRGPVQEGASLHPRMTLDISALNRQYGRLLQRHKQANIIINSKNRILNNSFSFSASAVRL